VNAVASVLQTGDNTVFDYSCGAIVGRAVDAQFPRYTGLPLGGYPAATPPPPALPQPPAAAMQYREGSWLDFHLPAFVHRGRAACVLRVVRRTLDCTRTVRMVSPPTALLPDDLPRRDYTRTFAYHTSTPSAGHTARTAYYTPVPMTFHWIAHHLTHHTTTHFPHPIHTGDSVLYVTPLLPAVLPVHALLADLLRCCSGCR